MSTDSAHPTMPSFGNSVATHPFNNESRADVIFTTSDNVDFYLLKGILIVASPFFEDMFSLPQNYESVLTSKPTKLERVPVSEASSTFDFLMRLCYPVPEPSLISMADLENVLGAAIKYELEEATTITKRILRNSVNSQTLYAFAIACRLRLQEEAALAAAAWKTKAMALPEYDNDFSKTRVGGSYTSNMKDIPTSSFFQLLRYIESDNDTFPDFICGPRDDSDAKLTESATLSGPFTENNAGWDTVLCCNDKTLFYVHSVILRLASAGRLLEGASMDQPATNDANAPRAALVNLDSTALRHLLTFCYPLGPSKFASLQGLHAALHASVKLGLDGVADAIKHVILPYVETQPLAVYLIASATGRIPEAQLAAKSAVSRGLASHYVPEMKEVPASMYYALLEFQYRCLVAVQETVETQVKSTKWKALTIARRKTMPVTISLPILETVLHEMKSMQEDALQAANRCLYCHRYYYQSPCGCEKEKYYKNGATNLLEKSEEIEVKIQEILSQMTVKLP